MEEKKKIKISLWQFYIIVGIIVILVGTIVSLMLFASNNNGPKMTLEQIHELEEKYGYRYNDAFDSKYTYWIVGENVQIFSEPKEGANIISNVKKGEVLTSYVVLTDYDNSFALVKYHGKIGWINLNQKGIGEKSEDDIRRLLTIKDVKAIYEEPNINAKKIDVNIAIYTELIPKYYCDGFMYVSYGGKNGWITASYFAKDISKIDAVPTYFSQENIPHYELITSQGINLYERALDTSSLSNVVLPINTKVEDGDTLLVDYLNNKTWIMIKYNNKYYWLSYSFYDESDYPYADWYSIDNIKELLDDAKIYEYPDNKSKIIGILPKDANFEAMYSKEYVDNKNRFMVYIEYNDICGWIEDKYIIEEEYELEEELKYPIITCFDNVKIYEKANIESKVVGTIEKSSTVVKEKQQIGDTRNWTKISYNGVIGFIQKALMTDNYIKSSYITIKDKTGVYKETNEKSEIVAIVNKDFEFESEYNRYDEWAYFENNDIKGWIRISDLAMKNDDLYDFTNYEIDETNKRFVEVKDEPNGKTIGEITKDTNLNCEYIIYGENGSWWGRIIFEGKNAWIELDSNQYYYDNLDYNY